MNKLKKIVIILIVTLIAILGISTTSKAYYVGQNLTLTLNEYLKNGNIFCLEHGQALSWNKMYYRIASQVKIEGTKSTDHTGKSIDNWANAKFAYILSQNNGTSKNIGPVANAVWNYAYTWMSNVGQYHAGLYNGFASSARGNATWLDQASTNYANNVTASSGQIQDNTKKDNIKVVAYNKDGKAYMRVGPFNWTFGGNVTEVNVYDQNGQSIGEKLYSSYYGNEERFYGVGDIKSGSDFYISVPLDENTTKITKITGNLRREVKAVNIWFLESSYAAYQNLILREPYTATENIEFSFDENISTLGGLKVIKVNKDNTIVKLKDVGFIIKNKQLDKYVKQENGKITFVSDKNQATEFLTNQDGEFTVENLIVGTYVAYETKNPNYGYEFLTEGQEKNIVIDKTSELQIANKQRWVKLSGYVWVYKIFGKQSLRNDLFKDNDYDSNDMLLDGIAVRVMDKTTGQVAKDKNGNELRATTANGGAYLFIDVEIDKLNDYYIEFEYDGLTYTNVVPHIDRDNGSKAAESSANRDAFNKNFSSVEGKTEDTGFTRDSNGNEKHQLSYSLNQNEHSSTLINNGQYPITAQTSETGYYIRDHFTYGQEEIKYINLGLYEREQPDMALLKDIQNVRVAVNGYQHVYNYAQRFVNQGEYGDGFNVGVKFGNKYGSMSYSRAVYKADYEYTNEQDASKELKVYITYKLQIRNESSNLVTQINSLVDYYDSRYKITKVGTGLDDNGGVTGEVSHTESDYNADYKKTTINANAKIDAQKTSDIYVEFELNRDAVINILSDKENLDNVAEINSYSIFDTNGNVYAGIDKDSNPGNAVPGEVTSYQDDTDSAPALKLEVADAREMSGKVFLDATSGELMTGKVRQGNGQYDDGEKGIPGVAITLTENTGSGKVYTATTDENGDFYINNYIPGDYTLTYTWGDKTYTVQNYKGTVYDASRDQSNKQWYKENVDKRLTDALDDYELRQSIDNEIKSIGHDTKTTIDKMNSTTPTMGIGVEYDSTYTASSGDRYVYKVSNVDFGIVERARQQLGLSKRVKSLKITLANGQVVTDITIDENGKIEGQKDHLVYMKPSATTDPKNGFVRVELDNELIQGSTLEVSYEIKATNESEVDYLSENFYKYGTVEGPVVTITPSAVIDYLDKNWAFDQDKNTAWSIKTLDEAKGLVAETVYNNPESTINNKTILYTTSMQDKKLEPTQTASVDLNVSKILSNSEDISLDNETEVTHIDKTGGSKTTSVPGNYVPGTGKTEADDNMAETVIVTPSTGGNKNFLIPTAIGTIALLVLGGGVFLIKRKEIKK